MIPNEEADQENRALRDRLSRLAEASLRINESLDFDTVLQGVLDSARSLTGARYGVLTLMDDTGDLQDLLFSGMTEEQGLQFGKYLAGSSCSNICEACPNPCGFRICWAT